MHSVRWGSNPHTSTKFRINEVKIILIIFMPSEINFTTQRTELCPYPEYWHAPDSEATETEVSEFIGSLIRLIQPEFVVETGTYKGDTTLEMARALHVNGHGRGVSLEFDKGRADAASLRLRNRISNSRMAVINIPAINYNPVERIDFAFFDSDMEERVREFRKFHTNGFLKKHAIVAFHDTAPHHKVRASILPLEEEGLVKFLWFNTPRGLALGQVQ